MESCGLQGGNPGLWPIQLFGESRQIQIIIDSTMITPAVPKIRRQLG